MFNKAPSVPKDLDRLVLDQSITRDTLGIWLERLGVDKIPMAKGKRIDALREVIGTPEGVHALVARMPPNELALFQRLVQAGGRGTAGERLTNNWWQLRLYHPVDQRPSYLRPLLTPEAAALQSFIDQGIVWVEREIRQVGLWLETLVAVHGRTFARWPASADDTPEHAPVPLHQHAHTHPDALSTLQSLLRQVTTKQAMGLLLTGRRASAAFDACQRGSTSVATCWRGWRCAASKSGIVVRFEIARTSGTRSTAHSRPEVSTTKASAGCGACVPSSASRRCHSAACQAVSAPAGVPRSPSRQACSHAGR